MFIRGPPATLSQQTLNSSVVWFMDSSCEILVFSYRPTIVQASQIKREMRYMCENRAIYKVSGLKIAKYLYDVVYLVVIAHVKNKLNRFLCSAVMLTTYLAKHSSSKSVEAHQQVLTIPLRFSHNFNIITPMGLTLNAFEMSARTLLTRQNRGFIVVDAIFIPTWLSLVRPGVLCPKWVVKKLNWSEIPTTLTQNIAFLTHFNAECFHMAEERFQR